MQRMRRLREVPASETIDVNIPPGVNDGSRLGWPVRASPVDKEDPGDLLIVTQSDRIRFSGEMGIP